MALQPAPRYTVDMNSLDVQRPDGRVPREIIRFEHPHEWQAREGFQPSLTLAEADVSHFVGGYNLPKDLYQHCGLAHGGKPCNQEHGHGFVVAAKDGQETQVGRDCGLRHLGAKFEELERLFTATVRTAELQKRMNDLVDKKAELLAKATAALGECDRAAASVGEIKHRIERGPSLAEVFHRAQGAEGSVYAEVRVSSEEYELTRKRFRREVWGRIDGIAAATERRRLRQRFRPERPSGRHSRAPSAGACTGAS